jgi:hypothetical protein
MEVALNEQANIHFSMEKVMIIMNEVQVSFVYKIIISAVKRYSLLVTGCHT